MNNSSSSRGPLEPYAATSGTYGSEGAGTQQCAPATRLTPRRPRDHQAERAALQAAADRLLDGTPLRSETCRLTVTELLRESGLRRDVVYCDHKDLVEEFQARTRAQNHTPALAQALADENTRLKDKLAETTSALAKERDITAALRRLVAELDLELHAARAADRPARITSLPARRRPTPRG